MKKALLLLALSFIFALHAVAQDRTVKVRAADSYTIHVAGSTIAVKGEVIGEYSIRCSEAGECSVLSNGKVLARAGWQGGHFSLVDSAARVVYQSGYYSAGYLLLDNKKNLINRIKFKEDKFNLYDASGARVLHGKPKDDGIGVKNEQGEQTLKIKGVSGLKEASYFALQIPLPYRLAFWAAVERANGRL